MQFTVCSWLNLLSFFLFLPDSVRYTLFLVSLFETLFTYLSLCFTSLLVYLFFSFSILLSLFLFLSFFGSLCSVFLSTFTLFFFWSISPLTNFFSLSEYHLRKATDGAITEFPYGRDNYRCGPGAGQLRFLLRFPWNWLSLFWCELPLTFLQTNQTVVQLYFPRLYLKSSD